MFCVAAWVWFCLSIEFVVVPLALRFWLKHLMESAFVRALCACFRVCVVLFL